MRKTLWGNSTHYYCGQETVEEEVLGLVSGGAHWEFRGFSLLYSGNNGEPYIPDIHLTK